MAHRDLAAPNVLVPAPSAAADVLTEAENGNRARTDLSNSKPLPQQAAPAGSSSLQVTCMEVPATLKRKSNSSRALKRMMTWNSIEVASELRVIRKVNFKRPQLLKKQFMIIDPRTSRFYTRWSWLTSFALIFTAIMTPVEVGFMDIPADRWADGLFITNRCVDIIFIFDSILQCFIMCASRSCRHAVAPRPLLLPRRAAAAAAVPSRYNSSRDVANHPASLAITCNHSPWCHLPRMHPVPWCATCRAGTRIRLEANPASRAPMVSTG